MLKEAFSGPGRGAAALRASDAEQNPLERWYAAHDGKMIHKWTHYFEIYHRHFARYRGKRPTVLEIGVSHGGSIAMWHDYFGAGCRMFGVDVNPRCKALEDAATTILIGDQADRGFLQRLRDELPPIDVLIDDGGHTMEQQIATFEVLYPHVAPDGVYLCEDLHTSYWEEFGGSYRAPGSFIEYSKAYIDQLNAWSARQKDQLKVNDFTRSTHSMHYYPSVLVIEKRPMAEPQDSRRGRVSW